MKLQKKIFQNISLFVIIAFIFISFISIYVNYNIYLAKEEKNLIKTSNFYASLYEENIDFFCNFIKKEKNYRLTIIKNTGEVMYDSYVDKNTLENHLDRPEIMESIEKDIGKSKRYSENLRKDVMFYAKLLNDGHILRLGIEMDNILSSYLKYVPINLFIIVCIYLLLILISSRLTRKIINPINNLSNQIIKEDSIYETKDIYDELLPFVEEIKRKELVIKKNIEDIKRKSKIIEDITFNMTEGIIFIDLDDFIVLINKSAISYLGGNLEKDYLNKKYVSLFRDIDIIKKIKEVKANKKTDDIILERQDKYISVFLNPVIIDEKLIGVNLLLVDRTEKVKNEKLRREFSSNVSHELKSPLTSIIGYAELIESGMVCEKDIKRFSSKIKNQGNRLLEIIESIIKLSKIEEKDKFEDFEKFKIEDIVKNVKNNFSEKFTKKGISVVVDSEDISILANKTMFIELFTNLFENTYKHSSADKVKIKCSSDDFRTYISFKDNGIGIPEEDLDRIFERFYVVDKSRSSIVGSSGLGLSIVKHIAEYHNGKVSIKSNEFGTEILIILSKNYE